MVPDILKSHSRRGFTLLELLIVIAIIGVLVSVGVASYSTAQKKTRDSRRRSDMKAVQSAFEQYYAQNSASYPALCADPGPEFMPNSIPSDPKGVAPYVYSTANCSTSSYCFCALLESGGGNAGSGCDYTASSKTYFCVSNLQ